MIRELFNLVKNISVFLDGLPNMVTRFRWQIYHHMWKQYMPHHIVVLSIIYVVFVAHKMILLSLKTKFEHKLILISQMKRKVIICYGHWFILFVTAYSTYELCVLCKQNKMLWWQLVFTRGVHKTKQQIYNIVWQIHWLVITGFCSRKRIHLQSLTMTH